MKWFWKAAAISRYFALIHSRHKPHDRPDVQADVTEQPIYRAAQVRELDRRAIQDQGIPGYTLMTRAATAALRKLRAHWPRARRIRVVCGAGNNAGDGYALARLAKTVGLDVRVGYLCDPARLQGDALTAHSEALAAGVMMAPFDARLCADVDVLVDALLGTGLERTVVDDWAAAIEAMNTAAAPILALDIPSGLHADTGAVLGCAIRAELTVTFIALKLGLFTGQGPDHVGQLSLATLDIPSALFTDLAPAATLLDAAWLRGALPAARRRNAHKGDFGHVLIIGGQPGMSGAPRLAALAAARCGAGLVSVGTHPEHAAFFNIGCPELMCQAVDTASALEPLMARATVITVGPGLGQSVWARELLKMLWTTQLPLIVDADALNLLAQAPQRRDNWILTPHPGEAARLLGVSTREVQDDRLASVIELQTRYGGVVVLKGAGTLIADGASVQLCTAGNPGMASGGMGDVLSGVIAALYAQGLPLSTAAAAAVMLHAVAGDAAAAAGGARGMLASDLLPELRRLMNPPPCTH